MKHPLLLLFICVICVSCRDDYSESEYSYGNYTVTRQDWNSCMTRLDFFDKDGNEIGTTLEYYPGRDGWFLADLIFGCNCIYYSACDACPKIIINDSSQFVVNPLQSDIPNGKKCWRRISSCDDAPVVKKANIEYGTNVTKAFKGKGRTEMPNWSDFPGKYWKRVN